jgi:hypothetical protein
MEKILTFIATIRDDQIKGNTKYDEQVRWECACAINNIKAESREEQIVIDAVKNYILNKKRA